MRKLLGRRRKLLATRRHVLGCRNRVRHNTPQTLDHDIHVAEKVADFVTRGDLGEFGKVTLGYGANGCHRPRDAATDGQGDPDGRANGDQGGTECSGQHDHARGGIHRIGFHIRVKKLLVRQVDEFVYGRVQLIDRFPCLGYRYPACLVERAAEHQCPDPIVEGFRLLRQFLDVQPSRASLFGGYCQRLIERGMESGAGLITLDAHLVDLGRGACSQHVLLLANALKSLDLDFLDEFKTFDRAIRHGEHGIIDLCQAENTVSRTANEEADHDEKRDCEFGFDSHFHDAFP